MAWHPRAIRKPLPPSQPMVPTAGITHSDAGYVDSLYGWWTNPASGGLSCHFHVAWDGTLEQYVDTRQRAYANVEANAYGLSAECSNSPAYRDGRVSFDDDAYSPAQIVTLIDLWKWVLEAEPTVRAEVCRDGVHGLGWHNQYPQWTTPGHACPGATRIRQLQTVIFPAVFGTSRAAQPATTPLLPEDDMPAFTTQEIPADGVPHVVPVPPPNAGALGWHDVYFSIQLASGNPAATVAPWVVVSNGAGFTSLPGLGTNPTVKSTQRLAAKLSNGTQAVTVSVPTSSPGPCTVLIEAG